MIIILPYTKEQTANAEKLVDWMFTLNDRKKLDACVLLPANNVHDEFKTKIRLSAEVAFHQVENIIGDPANLFSAASHYAYENLKSHWLYLDADSVPVKKGWQQELAKEYEFQPKKILGAWAKTSDGKVVLHSNSIYPYDLELFTSRELASMSTKVSIGGLIQIGKYERREDVSPNTVLYCSDKSGDLIRALRKEMKK